MNEEKKPKIQHQAECRKDLYMIAPENLQIEEGWNVRQDTPEYRAGIRILADAIKSEGVKESLTVYLKKPNNDIIITNGHRRFDAVKLAISEGAEIKAIPCRVEDRTADEADRTFSMWTRNSAVPLTPIEMSILVKQLIAFGWTVKDIATRTGTSVPHIHDLIKLSAAPVAVKEMINKGQVSATLAVETIKKEGEEKAVEVLGGAIESAAKVGKERVTRKNLDAPKSVKWSEVGPEAIQLLEDIKRFGYVSPSSNIGKSIEDIIAKGKV